MLILKYILITLWRIWFYVMMALPIIILFPILLVLTSQEKWYPQFFAIARFWAKFVLFGSGIIPKVKKEVTIDRYKSYMVVANHTSMADIMLILYCVKNPFVFVGKKELTKIPIFGFVYKRTCILVDRTSQKSKKEVFDRAQAKIKMGASICIFPEGGVSEDINLLLDEFRDGAFRLAIDHQIPILPLTFLDNKKRFSYHFLSASPGITRAYVHEEISTKGLTSLGKRDLKERVRDIILQKLVSRSL